VERKSGARALPTVETQKQVIATFVFRKLLMPLSFVFVCGAAILWFWWEVISGADYFANGNHIGRLVSGSIIYLFILIGIFPMLRQALFGGMCAVWIENDCLIYPSLSYARIPCADIAKVSREFYGTWDFEGICILKKDGKSVTFGVSTLLEDSDTIMDRIRRACPQLAAPIPKPASMMRDYI
jgi:hypothetical protein